MEQNKNKNGVIALLVIIIIILLALVVLFATGTINLKTSKKNIQKGNETTSNEMTDKSTQNAKVSNIDLINKLVGTYSYKGKYVDNEKDIGENFQIEETIYDEVVLNQSGEAEAKAGSVRAGGYTAKGKWYISNDEIIIINSNCHSYYISENDDKKCEYPNCSPIWIYKYKLENDVVTITSINNTMNTMTLEKIK